MRQVERNLELDDPFRDFESGIYPDRALSLYLAADRSVAYNPRYQEKAFEELAHESVQRYLDEEATAALRREQPHVIEHLRERRAPPDRALALFSYEPSHLVRSWILPEDEEPALRVGTRMYTRPLRRQLELHPPVLVVAADKEKARVYRMVLYEIEEFGDLVGRDVKRHRQGGWSSLSYQRREDQRARENLAEVAAWLNMPENSFYGAVRLAGPVEARAELKRLLAPAVRARLGDDLTIPLYLPPQKMAELLRKELAASPGRPA